MMHVSPCAWYCFEFRETGDWSVEDDPEKTLLTSSDRTAIIELIAARKTSEMIDVEISDFHEAYLKEEKILPDKTVMTENPHKVMIIVTRGVGPDERYWIICHAFWGHYCTFIRFHGLPQGNLDGKIQTYFNIINSLQPLALE